MAHLWCQLGELQVIAHRLSTVQSADEVAVVSEGTISERGSHAELLAAGDQHLPTCLIHACGHAILFHAVLDQCS